MYVEYVGYAPIDLKNCTVQFIDGGTNKITVKIGEGNMTITEKRNIQYYRNRGKIDTVREGDDEPVEVRIDCTWEYLKTDAADPGGAVVTPYEALTRQGAAAAWASSSSDACEPYAVDVKIIHNPPCASVKNEETLLADFRYEQIDFDPKAGTLSFSGKCNVKRPTITRTAVSTNV